MFITLHITNTNYNREHKNKQKSLLGKSEVYIQILKVITRKEDIGDRESVLEVFPLIFTT